MRKHLRWAAALVTAAVLSTTAACGSGGSDSASGGAGCSFGPADDPAWSRLLDEAVAEGTVNLYDVFSPDQGKRVLDSFHEVCPAVKVVETATGAALLPPVEQQIANGTDGADVFVWADEGWFEGHTGDVAELTGPSSRAYPTDSWFVTGKVPNVFINPQGFLMWNTQEFPDGFTSYEDLLDPALKGRIGTREDITTAYVGFLRFLSDSFGEDYLREFATQDPRFYPSAYVIPQAVASGEIGVANISTVAAVQALRSKGAPIDFTIPDKSYSTAFSMGVLAGAKRPAAAQVLADYLISEQGQTAIVGDGDGGSVLDVDGALDLADSFVLDATTVTPEVRAEWSARFDEIFR